MCVCKNLPFKKGFVLQESQAFFIGTTEQTVGVVMNKLRGPQLSAENIAVSVTPSSSRYETKLAQSVNCS